MKLLLQPFTPYDRSLKWNIHQNYFLKKGADAWLQGEVPYNVTSNSYAAFQIASLLYTTIEQMEKRKQLNKDEKIIVMELAAGVSLFAINFIKQFEAICITNKRDYFKRFQYILSDFSEKNMQDAAANVHLHKLQKSGHLVFAIVDALDPTKILELKTKKRITDIQVTAIIGNYAHDNLPLTVLRKKNTTFYEKHISLSIETEEVIKNKEEYINTLVDKPTDKDVLGKLIEKEKYVQFDLSRLDPTHKDVIQQATKDFDVATVVYPYGSFKAIKEALPLLKRGGFYCISDIGYANENDMEGARSGAPSIHGNSFAHNVNFPLIEMYARKLGLFSFRTSDPDNFLQTIIITLEKNKPVHDEFDTLYVAENFNEDAHKLKHIAKILIDESKFSEAIVVLKQVLRTLKYDANIYYRIGYLLRNNVGKPAEAVWYLTEGEKFDYFKVFDFAFQLGLTFYTLSEFKKSIQHYKKSLKFFGASKHTFYNIGLCYFELKEYQLAKEYFQKALAVDEAFEPAKETLSELLRMREGK